MVKNNIEKQKFLEIDRALTEAFAAAYEEALRVAGELEKRIADGDAFLSDYEIEISLDVFSRNHLVEESDGSGDWDYDSETVRQPISYHISHIHYEREKDETPLFLDESTNWNFEYVGEQFKDERLGYATHALFDAGWRFDDILKIVRIFTDVNVCHQSEKDLGDAGLDKDFLEAEHMTEREAIRLTKYGLNYKDFEYYGEAGRSLKSPENGY